MSILCYFVAAGCAPAPSGDAALTKRVPGDSTAASVAKPLPKPIRIRCGATETFRDSAGNMWIADAGFYDGLAAVRGDLKIEGTDNPALYGAERYSMTGFWMPVPNGKYVIKLHFCETYSGITRAGMRVFNANVEGIEIKDIDPYRDGGGLLKAVVKTVEVDVRDGKLDIVFTAQQQNTVINGIEIIPVSTHPMPPAPAGFDQVRNVPHGTVTSVEYESKTLGFTRKADIYTPPGYSRERRYPVLYLLHGGGDSERSWATTGRAGVILDNLQAQGKVVPMIVVMPNCFTHAPATARPARTTPEDRRKGVSDFEGDLLADLLPYVEAHYSVAADAGHRALAGLSMGGSLTLQIGPRHTDKFAYLCAFSAGLLGGAYEDFAARIPDATDLNARLKLFWVSCGDNDRYLLDVRKTEQLLTQKGINHTWHQDSGSHEWAVWRNDLYLVAPQLFRPGKDAGQ